MSQRLAVVRFPIFRRREAPVSPGIYSKLQNTVRANWLVSSSETRGTDFGDRIRYIFQRYAVVRTLRRTLGYEASEVGSRFMNCWNK